MADFAVLALDDVYMSSLGTFIDTFALIRHQVEVLFHSRQRVAMASRVHLLTSDGRPARLADGRKLAADGGVDSSRAYDLVHIPGFIVGGEDALDSRLAGSTGLCEWLNRQQAGGALISASGSAVFLLAEAGLLSGGVAAIARPLIPLFRRRYPGIRVDHLQAVVEYERIVTGTGLAADAQLLVRLVEMAITPELARWLADVTGLLQTTDDRLAEDPLVANAQLWLEERFAQDVRITELAAAMAVSQQTLLRHFNRHLGITPRSYLQRLRMEAAQRLLLRTNRPIEQVSAMVGYNDIHSFRTVFRAHAGCSASRFRAENGTVSESESPQ